MSAEAVLSATQTFICRYQPAGPARTDLIKAICALDKGTVQLFYDLGSDAGKDRKLLYAGAVATTIEYAAVQVADDLADGEGSYLECFARTAPGVCWGLQLLFILACRDAGLSLDASAGSCSLLLGMLDGQQRDVRTRAWNLEASRAAARMNELQFATYFSILLSGTELESTALSLGASFGFALHVFGDLRSTDPRVTTLTPGERRALIEAARDCVSVLAGSPLPCISRHARRFDSYLRSNLD